MLPVVAILIDMFRARVDRSAAGPEVITIFESRRFIAMKRNCMHLEISDSVRSF